MSAYEDIKLEGHIIDSLLLPRVLDDLNRIGVEFVSFREQIDTGGPLGRAIVVIIGAIAELERNLIIERVRAGMRRARLEGQHICRNPLQLYNAAIHRDRQDGRLAKPVQAVIGDAEAAVHHIAAVDPRGDTGGAHAAPVGMPPPPEAGKVIVWTPPPARPTPAAITLPGSWVW